MSFGVFAKHTILPPPRLFHTGAKENLELRNKVMKLQDDNATLKATLKKERDEGNKAHEHLVEEAVKHAEASSEIYKLRQKLHMKLLTEIWEMSRPS